MLFEQEFPEKSRTMEQAQWAFAELLAPRAPDMAPDDVATIYHGSLNVFMDAFYEAMSLYLKRPVTTARELHTAFFRSPPFTLRRLGWLFEYKGFWGEHFTKLALAQVYLAEVSRHPEHGIDDLVTASSLLRRIDNSLPHTMAWNDARLASCRIARHL